MSIKAIVFDVFDTLVANTPDLWLESFQRICHQQGLQGDPRVLWDRWIALERQFRRRRLDPATLEPRQPFESYEEVWTGCFRRAFQELGLKGDPSAAAWVCIQDLGQRPAFPGALEVLAALDGRFSLAILSNADRCYLYPLLDFYGIRGRFRVVVCSEEARAYKPYPGVFHQVLQRLGVSPEEALMVGDMLPEDVLGANIVGITAVWVNRQGLPLDITFPRPDYQLRDLPELLDIVRKPG